MGLIEQPRRVRSLHQRENSSNKQEAMGMGSSVCVSRCAFVILVTVKLTVFSVQLNVGYSSKHLDIDFEVGSYHSLVQSSIINSNLSTH